MDDVDMGKVRILAEYNSPITMRGVKKTNDLEEFKKKGREMGTIMSWKFGEVLVVEDAGDATAGLNNVLSAELMPMHFDGMSKTKKVGIDGVERVVPQPPQFQFFSNITPSPKNSGYTLFASPKLLFEHLPPPYTLDLLRVLTWNVSTTAFDNAKIENFQLVISHPTLNTPCLRYHEVWGRDKTAFDPTFVHIENGSDDGFPVIESLSYDRRVCYYHDWEEGDLLVSDNISMMHTRTGYRAGAPRKLWRIHVD